MTSPQKFITDHIISKDGTQIGYRQIGSGPGLILVHGGMMYSENFAKLAIYLAGEYTVYVPDRRGRGLSGPAGYDYSLMRECEDMQALIAKTKAQNIFGLSSGAIITLQTAIMEPALRKVALYEPPIPVAGTSPGAWGDDYERAVQQGNWGKAMMCVIKGAGDSSLLRRLPHFISAPLMNMAVKADAKEKAGKESHQVPLKTLIATMRYDLQIVKQCADLIAQSKTLQADTLLLGGTKSQPFLHTALDALSASLPHARRITFQGVGHTAADNGGSPDIVARELSKFFAAQ